jgi:hypothetical protein
LLLGPAALHAKLFYPILNALIHDKLALHKKNKAE